MVVHTYTLVAEAGGSLKFEPILVYTVNSKPSGAMQGDLYQTKQNTWEADLFAVSCFSLTVLQIVFKNCWLGSDGAPGLVGAKLLLYHWAIPRGLAL